MLHDDETTVREDWQEWSARLVSWFRRHASAEDAEDLAQETLLRMLRHLPELRDADRLEPWVKRIARHVLTDRLRTQRTATELVDVPETPEDDATVERTVAGWLATMIAALPAPDAEVLRRFELDDRTAAEIAEETGLGLPAVKSRILRGRAKLRARLLACCRFELDRRGGVVEYEKRGDCC